MCLTILPARWVLVGAEIPRLDEFSLVPGPHNQLGSFNIVLNAGSGLSGNKAALAALSRAANHWVSYFSDPININIDANLASLGSGIIGSTGSVLLQARFNTVMNAKVTDAAVEASNGIVGWLSTAAISLLDLRAFDLIGYDLAPVPVSSTWAGIIGISVVGAFEWVRRRRASCEGSSVRRRRA